MKRRSILFVCAGLFLSSLALAAEPNTLTQQELADGWILLFDGETNFGWKAASDANWKVADGVISVSSGEKGLLCTTSEFGDFALRVDFRAPKGTNSGVFLRTPAVPTDPAVDCYELNIAAPAVSPFSTGSFVARQKARGVAESEGWRTFLVQAEGGHFTVDLDGQRVLDYVDSKPLARVHRLAVQQRRGRVSQHQAEAAIAGQHFQRPRLDRLDAAGRQAERVFVHRRRGINVKDGPGQLESQGKYGDFVLQLEILSNGRELNSGVFFRNIPGEPGQGYECQVQNGYRDGDRTKPVDCGTGGFYRRQNARRVVSNDFEWFHTTLIVSGPHMAAWVNGYPVSDWTDTRAAAENPRNGLRLAAGTLSIQGHDKTTDLSFRKLRIAELAPR